MPPRLLILLAAVFALPGFADPLRIMPVGDSITYGSGAPGGYRNRLYQLLNTAGLNPDFIGTQTGNGVATLPDPDHQGHGGWRIDQIEANLDAWLATLPDPDFVLLLIGTNDFGQGVDIARAIDRLDLLLGRIARARPTATVLVSNLLERGEPHNGNIQTLFNPFLPDRVAAHAAAGRDIWLTDLRAAVPLADMPDNLHPNQTGYDKMADAWFAAVTNALVEVPDLQAPELVAAWTPAQAGRIVLRFSKPLADAATNTAHYAVSGGVGVLQARLNATRRTVLLETTPLDAGTEYTVTVNGVTDRDPGTPQTIAADSAATFLTDPPRGYLHRVPESAGYTLVYSLEIPTSPNYSVQAPAYTLDHHRAVGPFTRVAYYLELQKPGEDLEYAWVSMNAFTADPAKIGVPTLHTGAIFQQAVTNLNLVTNVAGLSPGSGLAGHLEFWPTNYSAPNAAGVPGASGSAYDFGDSRTLTGSYGSMQVHLPAAARTVFAFNRWGGTGGTADLGLGNRAATDTDWTFAQNAGQYSVRSLQVLVYTGDDTAGPVPLSAQAAYGRTQIVVRFGEPLAPASVQASAFSLDGGVPVLAARPGADPREVILTTGVLPEAPSLTLSVTGVRDTSVNANPCPPGSSVPVSAPTLPAEILAHIGAAADGYQLVCTAQIPATGAFNGPTPYTFDDRDAPGAFDRVAYYLELQRPGGPVQYVWTAMDAFATGRHRVAVPTFASGAVHQQLVSNLDVISNVAGVVNGTGLATGNIEFWPHNYSQPNAAGVPNASASTYDFGDTRATGGNHGSMQVHNHDPAVRQTVFSITNFGVDGNSLGLGIGNNPSPTNGGVDWTFAANGATYHRRVLHVLVRPSAPPPPPAEVLARVPESTNYLHVATLPIPASGNVSSLVHAYDVRDQIGPFDRVAYHWELATATETNWIWAAMDAFTTRADRIGVPTVASGAFFQQAVQNLDVRSNVPGVVEGSGLSGGWMEFWPSNYSAGNGAGVPGASDSLYDFGDTATAGSHGSMQLHNIAAAQTLFAFNNWGGASPANNSFALGIGNRPTSHPDWTFAANGASYTARTLHILVRPGFGDRTAPVPLVARPAPDGAGVHVEFDKAMAESAADPAHYDLLGFPVHGGTLLADRRTVWLRTATLTPGASYSVIVSGARDRSPHANPVAAPTELTFSLPARPAWMEGIPELSDYELLYLLPIPNVATYASRDVPYTVNAGVLPQYAAYDRVAYALELHTATTAKWVYVSCDAFTPLVSRLGVPTAASGAGFQQLLSNLNVYASPGSGIVTGLGLAGGNIEFWPNDYGAANLSGVPNASATLYDFGDERRTTGGYGSMQIHNHLAQQTLFAYNNWGVSTGNSCLGIGNHPNPVNSGVDWTFDQNAATYTVKTLHVFGRPAPASGPAPTLLAHPRPQAVDEGVNVRFTVAVAGEGPYRYTWRRDGQPLDAAPDAPWLDLPSVLAAQSGDYDVVVTALGGASATSEPAALAVSPSNLPPSYVGFRFTVRRDTARTLAHAALLAKADDPEDDPLFLSGFDPLSDAGGTVVGGAGEITYTPPAGFLGDDHFQIVVSDDQGGSVSGRVDVRVIRLDPVPAGGAAIEVPAGEPARVVFGGQPGQFYAIERNLSLSPVGWTTIAVVAADDFGVVTAEDPDPPSVRAYYRTRSPP
jgi:lysophospholipase L1-like esterase